MTFAHKSFLFLSTIVLLIFCANAGIFFLANINDSCGDGIWGSTEVCDGGASCDSSCNIKDPPIKKRIVFRIDETFLEDMTLEEAGERLSNYIDDINAVYAKNTIRRFEFDPTLDLRVVPNAARPNQQCSNIGDNYIYGIYIQKKDTDILPLTPLQLLCYLPENLITSNDLQWKTIYSDDVISSDSAIRKDYLEKQFMGLLRALTSMHGVAPGRYFMAREFTDASGIAPIMNANSKTPTDPYFSKRNQLQKDPLFTIDFASRGLSLEDLRLLPLSATIINRVARGDVNARCKDKGFWDYACDIQIPVPVNISVKIEDISTKAPLQNCSVKIFDVPGGSATTRNNPFDESQTNAQGTVSFSWNTPSEIPMMTIYSNIIRLIKVQCPGYLPNGSWITVFDLQAGHLIPNGGAEDDFSYFGSLPIFMTSDGSSSDSSSSSNSSSSTKSSSSISSISFSSSSSLYSSLSSSSSSSVSLPPSSSSSQSISSKISSSSPSSSSLSSSIKSEISSSSLSSVINTSSSYSSLSSIISTSSSSSSSISSDVSVSSSSSSSSIEQSSAISSVVSSDVSSAVSSSSSSSSSNPFPNCGNGFWESYEICEDGNTKNGDGCDETCNLENPPDIRRIRFIVSPNVLKGISSTEAANRLTKYVQDINNIFQKNTNRLFIYNPKTDFEVVENKREYESECLPIDSNYSFSIFIDYSDTGFSYGGKGFCNIAQYQLSTGDMYWHKLFTDYEIKNNVSEYTETQIKPLIRAIGQLHGIALSDYNSLSAIFDNTNLEPRMDILWYFEEGPYLQDHNKLLFDPLWDNPNAKLSSLKFSPLSATIINRVARMDVDPKCLEHGFSSLLCPIQLPTYSDFNPRITVRVLNAETKSGIFGCTVRAFDGFPHQSNPTEYDLQKTGTYGEVSFNWKVQQKNSDGPNNKYDNYRLFKAYCPGFRSAGKFLTAFDLQANKLVIGNGAEDDFRFTGKIDLLLFGEENNPKIKECGNGITEAGEYCDDGNTENNDGCNSLCAPEIGWQCTTTQGSASKCTLAPKISLLKKINNFFFDWMK